MTDTDLIALADKMSADQRHAVDLMSTDWEAGPRLSFAVLDHLTALRNHGLVDRQFADDTPVTITGDIHTELTARVSACWHFCLTPLGLRMQDHIRAAQGGEALTP